MGMVEVNAEIRNKMLSRVYQFGPPNSWKTSAIIKTAVYPLGIVSPPGEKGWGTIPDPKTVPGLKAFVWQKAPMDVPSSESARSEVEKTVIDLMAGKYGLIRTLAIDGFHKLYEVYLNIASGGAYSRGEDFKPQLYSRAHKMADNFLDMVLNSPVEYVTFTSWNAREPDKVGGDAQAAHEWPDLPGKAAKNTAGNFSVVVFNRVKSSVKEGKRVLEGEWLLKPDNEIWGASVKMDPRLVGRLPAVIPQDFKELYKVIGAAQQEAEREDSPAVA